MGGGEISLDSPIGDNGREMLGSLLPDKGPPPDELIGQKEDRELLLKKLEEFKRHLKGKELDIFENRIMAEKPLTLQQLGDKYNISRERVRQIQEKIIGKIKEFLKKEIPDFEERYSDFLK